MKCGICVAVFILLVALVLYFLHSVFEILTRDQYSPMSHCSRIETPIGPEDLQIFDNIVVSGYADRIRRKQRGGILFISDDGQVRNISLEGYPEKRSFNPVGLYILNTTLYLLNVDRGAKQDFIEYFELHKEHGKLEVAFKGTIKLSKPYYDQLNDIYFVNDKTFYVSTFRPESGDKEVGFFKGLSIFLMRTTSLLKCTVLNDLADCVAVDSGKMLNGLAGRKGELFAVDTADRTVSRYKINRDFSLAKLEEIPLGAAGDNIIYDAKRDKFYVAVLRIKNFLAAGKEMAQGRVPQIPGGVVELHLENGKWRTKLLFMQERISGLSSAIVLNGKMTMGSWIDNHILICPFD
eukprot:TRINITY_DN8259_c0_g2_i1.p1 TRINITY_DN8259_c0_g2~~TRINITY_DN8259_c0_g2_i1.p1  ORF type:complete len:350 (-),score=93.00 TRINITY_DN8259_c0_g2_i1:71-1120(-)